MSLKICYQGVNASISNLPWFLLTAQCGPPHIMHYPPYCIWMSFCAQTMGQVIYPVKKKVLGTLNFLTGWMTWPNRLKPIMSRYRFLISITAGCKLVEMKVKCFWRTSADIFQAQVNKPLKSIVAKKAAPISYHFPCTIDWPSTVENNVRFKPHFTPTPSNIKIPPLYVRYHAKVRKFAQFEIFCNFVLQKLTYEAKFSNLSSCRIVNEQNGV